jgi:hypothetical protein
MSPDIFNYRGSLAWAAAHVGMVYLMLFGSCIAAAMLLKAKAYARIQRLHPDEYGRLAWSRSVLESPKTHGQSVDTGKQIGEIAEAWWIDVVFFHSPRFLRLRDSVLNVYVILHFFLEIVCLALFISMALFMAGQGKLF